MELTTHAAVWGWSFLNSQALPEALSSRIDVGSTEPQPCELGQFLRGWAEQRAHPLGCFGGLNVIKHEGIGDLSSNMTQMWVYLAVEFSELRSTAKTGKRMVTF